MNSYIKIVLTKWILDTLKNRDRTHMKATIKSPKLGLSCITFLLCEYIVIQNGLMFLINFKNSHLKAVSG